MLHRYFAEPRPDCVPEYCRSKREDAGRDAKTDDDICRVICRNPACPRHRKGRY